MNQILTDEVMFALSAVATVAMLGIALLLYTKRDRFALLATVFVVIYLMLFGYYFSLALDPATTLLSDIPLLAVLGRPGIAGLVCGVIVLWLFILRFRGHVR